MRNDYHQPDIDGSEPDDYYEGCKICGNFLDWEECQQCQGDGGRFPYEDLPFEYAPDEWERCDFCDGQGGYHVCPNFGNHEEMTP
jgi:DnaJ-class molecular chaperone